MQTHNLPKFSLSDYCVPSHKWDIFHITTTCKPQRLSWKKGRKDIRASGWEHCAEDFTAAAVSCERPVQEWGCQYFITDGGRAHEASPVSQRLMAANGC